MKVVLYFFPMYIFYSTKVILYFLPQFFNPKFSATPNPLFQAERVSLPSSSTWQLHPKSLVLGGAGFSPLVLHVVAPPQRFQFAPLRPGGSHVVLVIVIFYILIIFLYCYFFLIQVHYHSDSQKLKTKTLSDKIIFFKSENCFCIRFRNCISYGLIFFLAIY